MEIAKATLLVQSPAFKNKGNIPPRYTCEGENISPAIEVKNMPPETKTMAVIMEDPDAPKGLFTHWVIWNLPPGSIAENTQDGASGINSFGTTGYGGPCPPSGTHRYYFNVYALDMELSLAAGEGKNSLREMMEGHILASGELMGTYTKKNAKNSL